MQFQTKPQKLIHIEKYSYNDRTTKEPVAVIKLHFADPTTTRVQVFSFKGDISSLLVDSHYVLDVGTYALDNGKSGFSLKSVTRAE